MTAQTEPLYVICWRSDYPGATGQGTNELPYDEALSVCKAMNKKDSHFHHWPVLVRHETQEPAL